jgi:hypothetical protein
MKLLGEPDVTCDRHRVLQRAIASLDTQLLEVGVKTNRDTPKALQLLGTILQFVRKATGTSTRVRGVYPWARPHEAVSPFFSWTRPHNEQRRKRTTGMAG